MFFKLLLVGLIWFEGGMAFDWVLGAGMAVAAVLAALGGVFILAALQAGSRNVSHGLFNGGAQEVTFLFDGDVLIDATAGARTILSLGPQVGSPMARLLAHLSGRFQGIEDRLSRLPDEGQFLLPATGDTATEVLQAELRGGLTRISIVGAARGAAASDNLSMIAVDQELATLRTTVSCAPYLIWREDADRRVVWANAAYLVEAANRLAPDVDLSWPLPRLFDQAVSVEATAGQRLYLERADHGKHWYDVRSVVENGDRLSYALPADAVVQAESTLRDFMQTLTKTFAHLPTGLAIFDQQRQLQLFNPALIDLTNLQPDFLTMRPTLFAVLDAMRDRHMIPEPKDYRNWRKQITDLEKAAASGQYEETWNLPSGQTYHVIGRPYPNGALALMFEDISTEMTRTRRYRADVELGQSVIDAMDDAMAVFAQSGLLVMTNTAYAELWGHDPATTLTEATIVDVAGHWKDHSAVTPLWAEAEGFLATIGARGPWQGEIRLLDGRLVSCKFKGLQGGARLASFRLVQQPATNRGVSADDTRKTA
jgi:PAS domain-containing protein